jgi:hypothetical protein
MDARATWRECYSNFLNSHVAGEFTHESLQRLLEESLNRFGGNLLNQTSQLANTVSLIDNRRYADIQYRIYDLDAWREIADRWAGGVTPIVPLPIQHIWWPPSWSASRPDNGIGSSENPQCISKTNVLMPTAELARMIARHLDGEDHESGAIGQRLHEHVSSPPMALLRQNYTYTAGYYTILVNDWLNGSGRFSDLGPRYNPSIESDSDTLPQTQVAAPATSPKASPTQALNATAQSQPAGPVSRAEASAGQSLEPEGGIAPIVATEDMIKIFHRYKHLVQQGSTLKELGETLERYVSNIPSA